LIGGAPVPDGGAGILKVTVGNTELPLDHEISPEADSVITSAALQINNGSRAPTVLITTDTNLRIRAVAQPS
jgi:predicted ribonuclease YlaK